MIHEDELREISKDVADMPDVSLDNFLEHKARTYSDIQQLLERSNNKEIAKVLLGFTRKGVDLKSALRKWQNYAVVMTIIAFGLLIILVN